MTEEQITKMAAEVAKILAKDIYGDALKPGMTQIGKAIETVLGLGNTVLTPIAMVNDKVKNIREKNLIRLESKLKEIEPAKIADIHPEIAVPVLRKLDYTENEDLANLFLNLLKTAANIDTAHLAHPAFVNLISNISPDEAKILNFMSKGECLCHINIKTNNINGSFSSFGLYTTILEFEDILQFKTNSKIYLSNLIGLGIISDFASPKNHPQISKIEEFLSPEWKRLSELSTIKNQKFIRGSYALTDFGELFVKCCTKNDEL